MLLAVALVVLVVGSIAFHFLSPWWFTPIASNWQTIDDTVNITFWVTGFVFVAINLFMAFAVLRYRHRPNENQPARYEPENKKLEIGLTIVTAIGVAAMLAPGLYVWAKFIDVPAKAWEFEALGEQWRWSFRLPGEDGQLGTTDPSLVSKSNQFGINPQDLQGLDDVLVFSNQIHIPQGKPVKVLLRSKDVLHDFAVPQFRVKMDLVPGLVTYLWFTPTRTGTFEILCEELCGVGHFTMRGRISVDTEADFQQWLAGQQTFKDNQSPDTTDIAKGKSLYTVCSACHGAQGEGNQALNSPRLSGQHSWYLSHQIENFKAGIRGTHPEDTFGQQMAPMAMLLADQQAVRDVSVYIASLTGHSNSIPLNADINRGKSLYVTCATCHGTDGQGKYAMNAPRISGQGGWYLHRQLQNFRTGIRGAHPDDLFGPQMGSMSRYLRNDQAIEDVIAYINTLAIPNLQTPELTTRVTNPTPLTNSPTLAGSP